MTPGRDPARIECEPPGPPLPTCRATCVSAVCHGWRGHRAAHRYLCVKRNDQRPGAVPVVTMRRASSLPSLPSRTSRLDTGPFRPEPALPGMSVGSTCPVGRAGITCPATGRPRRDTARRRVRRQPGSGRCRRTSRCRPNEDSRSTRPGGTESRTPRTRGARDGPATEGAAATATASPRARPAGRGGAGAAGGSRRRPPHGRHAASAAGRTRRRTATRRAAGRPWE